MISFLVPPFLSKPRRSYSAVENKQVRICPSAVTRILEHAPQNASVTAEMIPISPLHPSANRYFQIDRKDLIDTVKDLTARNQVGTLPFTARIERHKLNKPYR